MVVYSILVFKKHRKNGMFGSSLKPTGCMFSTLGDCADEPREKINNFNTQLNNQPTEEATPQDENEPEVDNSEQNDATENVMDSLHLPECVEHPESDDLSENVADITQMGFYLLTKERTGIRWNTCTNCTGYRLYVVEMNGAANNPRVLDIDDAITTQVEVHDLQPDTLYNVTLVVMHGKEEGYWKEMPFRTKDDIEDKGKELNEAVQRNGPARKSIMKQLKTFKQKLRRKTHGNKDKNEDAEPNCVSFRELKRNDSLEQDNNGDATNDSERT
ncbi:uncharacterized protein LOC144439240 [Glandiceps talaboti]